MTTAKASAQLLCRGMNGRNPAFKLMDKTKDDLAAVRTIADALEPFQDDVKERILRWARELAGLPVPTAGAATARPPLSSISPEPAHEAVAGGGSHGNAASGNEQSADIRSFAAEKSPKSDVEFAATIAYYYRFVTSEGDRKDTIGPQDYVDACRMVGRQRPKGAEQTLRNALTRGYLDRVDRGRYRLNSVGENLVAMVLPSRASNGGTAPQRRSAGKKARKNAGKKAGKNARK